MRKMLIFIASVFLLVGMRPVISNAETEYENINGIIYNEATGEKVDDVDIKNFQINRNKVNFIIKGRKTLKLSAEFTESTTLENNLVRIYKSSDEKYILSLIATDNFITGSVKINETSLLEKFNPNYNEFAVAINLDNTIDFDYELYLNEIKKSSSEVLKQNKEASILLEEENNNFSFLEQESTLIQKSQISTASTSTAYVNASTGSVVAEASARYRYVGGNHYNIDKITWITTSGILETSYISVWSDPNASSALWYSSEHGPKNRTNISYVSLTVPSSGGALVAQVQKPGFVKVYKVPIPYVVSDFDFWYF